MEWTGLFIAFSVFVDNVITRDIKLDPKSWIIFKKYDVNAVSPIAIFENQWPVNKVYLQTKAPFGAYRRLIGQLIEITVLNTIISKPF